jgi:hypothetical protein
MCIPSWKSSVKWVSLQSTDEKVRAGWGIGSPHHTGGEKMLNVNDLALKSASVLFSSPITTDRFKSWATKNTPDIAGLVNSYAFGEIFWKKALGRPNTAKLSDGFVFDAWHDQQSLDLKTGHWIHYGVPYVVMLSDGKDDEDYWRVVYMVPRLAMGNAADGLREHDEYTHFVPGLAKGIAWSTPGGVFASGFGFRTLSPHQAVFVKGDQAVHYNFEVILQPPL